MDQTSIAKQNLMKKKSRPKKLDDNSESSEVKVQPKKKLKKMTDLLNPKRKNLRKNLKMIFPRR